jgi:hypothetical protein
MFGTYPTPEPQTIHIIACEFPRIPLLETVWKLEKGFILATRELLRGGKRASMGYFLRLKTRR